MTLLQRQVVFVALMWAVVRTQRVPPWRQEAVEARSFEDAKEVGSVEDDFKAYVSPVSVRHGLYLKVWAEVGQSIEAYLYRRPKETSYQAELVLVAPLDPEGLNLIVGSSRQTAGKGFSKYGTRVAFEEQFGWPTWEAPVIEWFTRTTTITTTEISSTTVAPTTSTASTATATTSPTTSTNVSNSTLGNSSRTTNVSNSTLGNSSRLLRAMQEKIPLRKAEFMYKTWGPCGGLLKGAKETCYEPGIVADPFLPRAASVLASGSHIAQVAGWHYWIAADLRHTTRSCQLKEDPANKFLVAGQKEACGLPVAIAVGPGKLFGFGELLQHPQLAIRIHVWEGHSIPLLVTLPLAVACLSLLALWQLDARWKRRGEGFLKGVVLADALLGSSVGLYSAAVMYRWIITISLIAWGQVPVFEASIMFFVNATMVLVIAAPWGHWKYLRCQLAWSAGRRGVLAVSACGSVLFFGTGMYIAPALSLLASLLPIQLLIARIDCVGPTDILKCLQRCFNRRRKPPLPLPPPGTGERLSEFPRGFLKSERDPPPAPPPISSEQRPPPPGGAPPEGINQIRSGGAFPGLGLPNRQPAQPPAMKVKHGLAPVSVTDLWKQNQALKEENEQLRAAAESSTPHGTSPHGGGKISPTSHPPGDVQEIGESTRLPTPNLAPSVVGTPQKPARPFIPRLKLPLPGGQSTTPPRTHKEDLVVGGGESLSESTISSERSSPREEPPSPEIVPAPMPHRSDPPAPPSWKKGHQPQSSPQPPATPRSSDGVVFMLGPTGDEDPFIGDAPPTPKDADSFFFVGDIPSPTEPSAILSAPEESTVPTGLPPPPPLFRPPKPTTPLEIARRLSGLSTSPTPAGASTPNRVATPPLTPTTSLNGLGLSMAQRRET